LPTKIDPNGVVRVYDPNANIFGSYNSDGSTKTFYKPDPAQHGYPSNIDYWNAQKGKDLP
jgi:filamentous hemagglutinin